nr:Mut7-C RNAse domain-containing protein [Motilibacter deserti]
MLLDVHLGALARRLRLLGVDTAYANDASDPQLVERAAAEDRLLLTQDRGLLRRRALRRAAYVRGARPDDQLEDVLDRFELPVAPYTRCTVCNGRLEPVAKADVVDRLEPGTQRTQEVFVRCVECARVYWHGAHSARLDEQVRRHARRRGPGGDASG